MAAASTPSSVNSSIDSATGAAPAAAGTKNVNFLSQLEQMMNSVKKEAAALENMKLKLKDAEELKKKLDEAKGKIAAAESENQQLRRMVKEADDQNIEIRNDMQRLNDIYYTERGKLTEAQQQISRLEQELNGVKMEKDFFATEAAKVPDLKSAVKTGKAQLSALKKSIEEEKAVNEQRVAEVTRKCTNLEKLNEESGKHLFNLTETINTTQNQVRELQDAATVTAAKLSNTQAAQALATDRWLMTSEDLRTQVGRVPALTLHFEDRIGALKAELQKTKLLATGKTNEVFLLTTESKKLQEKLELGSQAYTNQINALQDQVRELSAKNAELVKGNASAKQKLASKTTECEHLGKEVAELKQALKQQTLTAQQRELESNQTIKGLTLQGEDVAFKLQSLTAQHEALQQQIKAEQAKHWEEVKQLKAAEASLLEECDRLTQEVHEKTVSLHALESENTSKESNMRSEVANTAQMVATLKDELERRLKDLVQLREERDALAGEKEELTGTVESLKAEIAKNDNLFKRTLEADRNKMKQELQTRTSRIRSLENEKQELLSETQGLMAQVTESMQEVTALQSRHDEVKQARDILQEQVDVLKSHNNQLIEDLKAADRAQEEMREFSDRQAAQHRQDSDRLELLLRESKKAASQTVLEMSQNLKQMSSDYDALQREHEKAQDSERRAISDAERLRNELNAAQLAHQETQYQLNTEVNNVRRELQEHRNKAKIVMESKTRVEMELINLRAEMGKMEMEAHKQNVVLKEGESTLKSLEESLETTKAQLASSNENCSRLKSTVTELEEGMQRKNSTIDGLKEELLQLEREGVQEIRRLRMQLTSAEHEISELRPMIPLLQKEAAEAKATVMKLQNNQSGTVNGLLEEVRRAEENLVKERKRAGAEVESCHNRITELQVQLEKTRELLEEATTRSRAERSDRDLRLMQLEGEAERAKSAAAAKEARIEELVQQHHADRVKIHELHEKAAGFDSEMASLKSALSHEQAHRQRLEARLRQLMSTPDFAAEGLGAGGNTGFLSARGHSSHGGRKPGAFNSAYAQPPQGSGSGSGPGQQGGTSNYHAGSGSGSHDAWEEDGQDDAYSVGGHTHLSNGGHSGASHYSGSTQAYNHTSGHHSHTVPPRIAFHNSDNGSSGMGDAFGYSAGGMNVANSGVRAQSPFASAARGNYRADEYAASLQQFQHQQSDRGVRSSRADFGAAQDRDTERERYDTDGMRSPQRLPGQGQFTPTKETQRRGVGESASQYSPRGGDSAHGASSRHAQSPVVDRVSAALAARAAAESSKSALRLAQQQRSTQSSRHPAGAAGATTGGGGTDASDSVSQSAAESIRRTQELLARRGLGGSIPNSDGAGAGREKTPNSGRSATRLSESIQQANSLYPPSPQRYHPDSRERAEDDGSYQEPAYLDAPALRPLSPPSMRGPGAAGAGQPGSGDSVGGEGDDAEGAYDSDGDSVGGGAHLHGGRSLASVAPSGDSYAGTNPGASVGTGAGTSSGGPKKTKKGSKKASSDLGKHYGGLEEALQLPKIGASGSTRRK